MKDIKESNPVEIADYVSKVKCVSQPAFAWRVPYVLKKRDRIISSVNSRFKKQTHKYGRYIPTGIQDAYDSDKRNGNTVWRNAMGKEMLNNDVTFKEMEEDYKFPPGYTEVYGRMIFDAKMDFTRKARFFFHQDT